MNAYTNDITDLLHDIDPSRITYIVQSDRVRYHAAITALVAAITDLLAERDALRQQRDEARREACLWALPQGVVWNEAMIARGTAIAAERGWDCYAKEGGGA